MDEKEVLKNKLAETEAELNIVLEVNAQLTLEIERLTSEAPTQNSQPKTHNLQEFFFQQDGIKYGFNYFKTKHNGQEITPVEICADAQLQKELISKKAGIIKQL
jgi:hypothetical protein